MVRFAREARPSVILHPSPRVLFVAAQPCETRGIFDTGQKGLVKKWQMGGRGEVQIMNAENVMRDSLRSCGERSISTLALLACGQLGNLGAWRMPVLPVGLSNSPTVGRL